MDWNIPLWILQVVLALAFLAPESAIRWFTSDRLPTRGWSG